MGGSPSKGTKADKRLKENKTSRPTTTTARPAAMPAKKGK